MSDPDYCYKCGEIVTFCECDKSITKPWDALEHFRDRCGELEAEVKQLREDNDALHKHASMLERKCDFWNKPLIGGEG